MGRAIEVDLGLPNSRHVPKNADDPDGSETETVPEGRSVLSIVSQRGIYRLAVREGRTDASDFRLVAIVPLEVAAVLAKDLVPLVSGQAFECAVDVDQRGICC